MSNRFEEFSYEELVEKAKKDIKLIKEEIFPFLKSKKVYTPVELREIVAIYMNVGINMSYFRGIASDFFSKNNIRKQAQELYDEYKSISIETDVILDMKKEENEKE